MELVEVTWLDAWADTDSFSSAHGITITHKPMTIYTLGWLVHEDEVGISVANERSVGEDGETYRGRTFIPSGMIKSVTHYKLTKPRRLKQCQSPLNNLQPSSTSPPTAQSDS